ncbi:MAG: DUF3383 domain-containing protein, partial [bacterium]|nr:DUF3383 domain-containing protein [bacterium]
MATVTDFVDITIDRQTSTVSRAGFGTLNIMGTSDSFTKVDTVVITLDADLVASNSVLVTVNGTAMSPVVYAASHVATMGVIATAIQGLAEVSTAVVSGATNRIITVTAVYGSDVTVNGFAITLGASQAGVTIARDAAVRVKSYTTSTGLLVDFGTTDPEYIAGAIAFSQSPRPNTIKISQKRSEDASWTTALAAIQAEDDDWYGMTATTRTKADQLLIAAWAETQTKICGFSSNDAGTLTTGTTDIGAELEALNYDRSYVAYHTESDLSTSDMYPETAWMAEMFAKYDPGNATWMFKTLTGVTADTFTSTQSTNATDKNVNLFQDVGGVDIMFEGTMASGEFIDTMRFVDWLHLRLQE